MFTTFPIFQINCDWVKISEIETGAILGREFACQRHFHIYFLHSPHFCNQSSYERVVKIDLAIGWVKGLGKQIFELCPAAAKIRLGQYQKRMSAFQNAVTF